jgi:hypothetical protein
MYPHEPPRGRDAAAKQEQLWTTILDYRHAAGLKLMADDFREQARAEAALALALHEAGAEAVQVSPLRALRQRVGGALVRAGRRLQGASRAGGAIEAVPARSTGGSG